ncbi:MAG: AAA family ATPase [Chloroflexota bacterium]
MAKYPGFVMAMLVPSFYPHSVDRVELVQTQMSFVFLAGDYVYKVKKPVNLGYLDYTTLEKRRFFCERELELNRRLAPDVYLAVAPIAVSDGGFSLGEGGAVVEYAVKMRRLPPERMMNVLLPSGHVTARMVNSLSEKLVRFHEKAGTSPEISVFASLKAIKVNTDENFSQTIKYLGISIDAADYNRIKAFTEDFLASKAALFRERIRRRRIRDCHGDLHAAHICFTDGIQIYDCIEFNDRFRYCDVASEIAFLAMDLDRYDRGDLSREFVDAYINASQDIAIRQLLPFYKCYRAYVRGKVESFKLDDPYIAGDEKEKTLGVARSYFSLARRYTVTRPALLIVSGLMGTGKTTLAEAVGRKTGAVVISSDVVRKRIAGIQPTERRYEGFESGIYSADFTKKTYDTLYAEASRLLAQGQSVILDASFKKRDERLRAAEVAVKAGARFVVVECVLDEAIITERLRGRAVKGTSASDGRLEILGAQKADFDTIAEFSKTNHIVVDTSHPPGELADMIVEEVWQ